MESGIRAYTHTIGWRERRVDVAVLATSGCDTAKPNSTSWVRLYLHRVVTYNSDIPRWKHYRECAVHCSICMSNCQSTVGVPGASIGDQSRACETRLYLFLYPFIVCVCVVFLFILDVRLVDVPAGATQKEGHTGFLIHLTSAVLALIFLARSIRPFLSLVDREVQLLCTNTN